METMPSFGSVIMQLGVGGIFALLVLRLVFDFLTKRRTKGKNNNQIACGVSMERFGVVEKQVADLYKWHDQSDQDGVKIWYVRRSLEDAMNKLSENLELQTQVLQGLVASVHDVCRDVGDIKGSIKQ